jgi:hypothetical protein
MSDYFTNADTTGCVRYDRVSNSVAVVGGLHQTRPIGTASLIGQTAHGVAVWRLDVGGVAVRGRWVLVGKWFVPDEDLPA